MSANPSDIDLLRQRITELEAENIKLKAEKVEIEVRNAELLKQVTKGNVRRDAEIAKLKAEVAKLRENHTSSNFNSTPLERPKGAGTDHHEEASREISAPNNANTMTSENDELVSFQIEGHKKSVAGLEASRATKTGAVGDAKSKSSEEIGRRNKEKMQRESTGQDNTSDTLSCDAKTVNTVHCFPENSNLSQDSSDRLPGLEGGATTMDAVNGQTYPTGDPSSKIVTEFVQGLLEELLSSDNRLLEHIKFSSPKTIVPGSISIKRLANSFCQANGARNKSIMAKQTEISLWWCYSEKFEDKVVELRSGNKKLTDKTARSQIYAEMKPYLPGVSDGYLRKITSKARKINKLFGYEYDPVTLQKLKEQVKSKTIANQRHVANPSTSGKPSGDVDEIEDLKLFDDEPGDSDNASPSTPQIDYNDVEDLKLLDDDEEDDIKSQNEALRSSDSDSDTNSECDEQFHDELTRIEMERLKALEAGKKTTPFNISDYYDESEEMHLIDDDGNPL